MKQRHEAASWRAASRGDINALQLSMLLAPRSLQRNASICDSKRDDTSEAYAVGHGEVVKCAIVNMTSKLPRFCRIGVGFGCSVQPNGSCLVWTRTGCTGEFACGSDRATCSGRFRPGLLDRNWCMAWPPQPSPPSPPLSPWPPPPLPAQPDDTRRGKQPQAWLDWTQACRETKGLDTPAPDAPRRIEAFLEKGGRKRARALRTGAAQLRDDLMRRNVLCSPESPCNVTEINHHGAGGHGVEVCLPPSSLALNSRVCGHLSARTPAQPNILIIECACTCAPDPFGEAFQQVGGLLQQTNTSTTARAFGHFGKFESERRASGLEDGTACIRVNLTQLAGWWAERRATDPFLTPDDPRLEAHVDAKKQLFEHVRSSRGYSFTLDMPPCRTWHALSSLLQRAAGSFKAQSHARCAFVGSGHDLRCGRPVGRVIDGAYDAVFRANAAQQLDHPQHHYISPKRAGRRTDYRTNCLHRSQLLSRRSNETCILPRSWWRRAWDKEVVGNTKHKCCDEEVRSNYAAPHLAALSHFLPRAVFVWLNSAVGMSGGQAVDGMLHNTGGNTLLAAIHLCDRVDVYGAGLFSRGPASPKLYVHNYDPFVGACRGESRWNPELGPRTWALAWLKRRLADELTLHVLHAFGIIRWQTAQPHT